MDEQISSGLTFWLSQNVEDIRKGIENPRYLFLFSRDFQAITGDIPCTSCKSFIKKFERFKTEIMARKKADKHQGGYELKAKYNGLYGYVNPLSKKEAEKLVKEHPKGLDLFKNYGIQENQTEEVNADNG